MRAAIQIDRSKQLPAPSINKILDKISPGSTWDNLKSAIPMLGDIASTITVTDVEMDLDWEISSSTYKVARFSINAQITDLQLLSSPAIAIDTASITLIYTGTYWSGRIETEIFFADQYRCSAALLLPTPDEPGSFQFNNLSEDFTLGAFVQEIGQGMDLKQIPIIGSSAIADLRLEYFSLGLGKTSTGTEVTECSVELDWPSQDVGQLPTRNNTLAINWKKTGNSYVPSILAPEPTGNLNMSNIWSIQWQGNITNSLYLDATVQRGTFQLIGHRDEPLDANEDANASSGGADRKEEVSETVLFGQIYQQEQQLTDAGALTNLLTGTAEKTSTLWQDNMPKDVNSTFTLQRCAVSIVLGEQDAYAVGAQATWGDEGKGSAVLIVKRLSTSPVDPSNPPHPSNSTNPTDPANPSGQPSTPDNSPPTGNQGSQWGFTLAVSVQNLRIKDLSPPEALTDLIDSNLVRVLSYSV